MSIVLIFRANLLNYDWHLTFRADNGVNGVVLALRFVPAVAIEVFAVFIAFFYALVIPVILWSLCRAPKRWPIRPSVTEGGIG